MPELRLHRGDWREIVATWPRPCVLITDPPYGVKHRETGSHTWKGGRDTKREDFEHRVTGRRRLVANDHDTRERDEALEAIGWESAAVFGPRRIDRVPPWGDPRDILVLDKGQGVGAGDLALPWKPCWETIAIYGPGWEGARTSGVLRGTKIAFRAENAANGRRHPTEKPLAVLRELVRKAPRGLPIVDPFMGSGTTGVAALEDGRDFYGAEIEPGHFSTCVERLDGSVFGFGLQRELAT
jgi:site-specific DNA-methyltransferase (adenine-specific)